MYRSSFYRHLLCIHPWSPPPNPRCFWWTRCSVWLMSWSSKEVQVNNQIEVEHRMRLISTDKTALRLVECAFSITVGTWKQFMSLRIPDDTHGFLPGIFHRNQLPKGIFTPRPNYIFFKGVGLWWKTIPEAGKPRCEKWILRKAGRVLIISQNMFWWEKICKSFTVFNVLIDQSK